MILSLANKSLISGGKISEAGYVCVCNGEEVNIYDVHTSKNTVSEKDTRKGWRYPHTRLCRILLQAQVTNLNLHTLILNGPTGQESFNSLYTVPSSAAVLEHIERFNNDSDKLPEQEAIHNVYDLPSI